MSEIISSVDKLQSQLDQHDYIADRALATAIYLNLKMERPLFLEGEPGVGKTEVAKVLSKMLGAELIRLQCYEGLDVHNAIYEWNYSRQIIEIKMIEASGGAKKEKIAQEIFGPEFLIRRPLLRALDNHAAVPPVLLIDELDRADEEFEAFLLEILSDYQITIPEIGTIKSIKKPVVIITSNRTREIHDALKRRCIYHWIPYPKLNQEIEIVHRKLPEVNASLARQVVAFIHALREMDLYKLPGVAETLDWSTALLKLGTVTLNPEAAEHTMGTLLKYQDDIEKIQGDKMKGLVERAIMDAQLISAGQ